MNAKPLMRFLSHLRRQSLGALALFIVLGGTSYAAMNLPANSVGAKQIKKDAVRTADVKNRSLQAADFEAGQLRAGRRGAQGIAGERGARGPEGAVGRPGATNVVVRTDQAAVDVNSAQAQCLAGERAVGGGGSTFGGGENLYNSSPIGPDGASAGDGATPTGWEVSAHEGPSGPLQGVTVYVLCAAP